MRRRQDGKPCARLRDQILNSEHPWIRVTQRDTPAVAAAAAVAPLMAISPDDLHQEIQGSTSSRLHEKEREKGPSWERMLSSGRVSLIHSLLQESASAAAAAHGVDDADDVTAAVTQICEQRLRVPRFPQLLSACWLKRSTVVCICIHIHRRQPCLR